LRFPLLLQTAFASTITSHYPAPVMVAHPDKRLIAPPSSPAEAMRPRASAPQPVHGHSPNDNAGTVELERKAARCFQSPQRRH